jgi:hypothetical protein
MDSQKTNLDAGKEFMHSLYLWMLQKAELASTLPFVSIPTTPFSIATVAKDSSNFL